MVTTLTILAFLLLLAVSAVGVALALLTLPGAWLILIAGIVLGFGTPALAGLMGHTMAPLYDERTLIVCGVLALLAEIIEFVASAAGAKRAGGGRGAMVWAMMGGLVGGLAGGMIIPIVGAIPGGVLGAGLGAVAAERTLSGRTWRESSRVGQGAAAGKLGAIVAKGGAAGVIALILLVNLWR